MKHLLSILLLAALMSAGCRKDPCYQDSGTILGFDYRKCRCCSGWFIKIEKDTLRFQTLPEGSTVNLNDAKFPVEVYLDWHYPDPQCMKDMIIVTRMQLKK